MELIKNIEEQNRPREKMIREGAQSLTDVELLAIIIGSGTKNNSVLSISKSLLDEFGSLSNLLLSSNTDINPLITSLILLIPINEFKSFKISSISLSFCFQEFLKFVLRNRKEKGNFKSSLDFLI